MLISSFPNKWLSSQVEYTLFRRVVQIFTALIVSFCLVSCQTSGEHKNRAAVSAPCSDHNVLVSTNEELQDELSQACAGSVIRLVEGVWTDVVIDIKQGGSSEAPLIIKADKPGKTYVEGRSYIISRGDYVHIIGFYFRNGYPGIPEGKSSRSSVIAALGSYNLISENTIEGFDKQFDNIQWLKLGGQHSEVSYNRFQNKTKSGVMLAIDRNSNAPQYHHIHHNHFKGFADGGGQNGREAIRLGSSKYSQSDSHSLIEKNRFDHCDGELEIISVKSGRNTIRENVFVDSRGFLTLRHGKHNIVDSNVFMLYNKKDGGGIRIIDDGHIVANNYIAGVRTGSNTRGGIVLHSGNNLPGTEHSKINGYWTPFNITITNNTIVDSEQSFLFGGKKKYAAENIRFKNNVISSAQGKAVMRVDKVLTKASFDNERYFGESISSGKHKNLSLSDRIIFDEVELRKNNDGLLLHPTSGAQGLKLLRENDVGPRLY